eukprot:9442983-Prorocentrum_lima.AAC.1
MLASLLQEVGSRHWRPAEQQCKRSGGVSHGTATERWWSYSMGLRAGKPAVNVWPHGLVPWLVGG